LDQFVPRCYRLYGLNIECDMPLPCPPAVGEDIDLSIRWRGFAPHPIPASSCWTMDWTRDGGGWLLRYCRPNGMFLEFRLEPDGSAITALHHSPFGWSDILTVLLGPAMGAVLHLRRIPVLHGGAVAVNGEAVLLLGPSEAGKSTLTAALVNAGQPLICEEVAAIRREKGGISLQSAHPLLKLSPRSILSLGMSPAALPFVFSDSRLTDERWLDARTVKGGFHNKPAPLRAVYLIAGRCPELRTARFTDISPAEACLALCNCFYGAGWLHTPPAEGIGLCAQIAAAAQVRQVWLPEGIDTVGASARTLVDDVLSPKPSRRSRGR
jgi:hypothetical protein